MKRITKATMPLAALAGIALAATSANAAAISHLGNYINYGDGWRSTGDPDKDGGGGVANSDPNGDNAWGSDGYYVARASAVASSLPAYITSVGDNRLGISNEVTYDDATLAIANDVADVAGVFYQNGDLTFTVTLEQDATFVLTVIFDTSTGSAYDVASITVDGPGPTSATTTGLTSADEIVDYAFFEVSGEAGDVFTVTGKNQTPNNAISGLGFEAVPDTDPTLTGTDPADDATVGVAVGQNLVMTFDETVQAGTSGTIALWKTSPDTLVESFDVTSPTGLTFGGTSVTINPAADLVVGVEYYVLIEADAIVDTSSNGFAGITVIGDWSFSPDATPPAVGTIDSPANEATGVPVDGSLALTFDEDMQKGTGNIVIKRTGDNGVVDTIDVTTGNVVISGGQVTITPNVILPTLTELYVEIEAGALQDLAGNSFAGITGSGTWSFTTAAPAPIAHLGNYINYGDGWRSTGDPDKDGGGGVANSDPNGDNAWGSDGYYVARSSAVASSLPAYIASVTDNRQGISNEVTYDDATLAIANDVADAPGVAFLNATPLIFTFTLAQDATFVLTAIFDTATTPSYYVEGITVDGPTASDDTTGLSGDETVDYAFFEVSGEAGDVFTVTVANSNSNYAMSGLGFEAVPETGVAITEITSVGGGTWELTLEGEASTGYEFRSSPILDFDPGALVINLTQGAPGDPGDISGTNDSVLTTDGNGDGTVRMMLAGPANFVRAQIPPPLLEEDFEGLAGLPADWSASDNGALTAWSVGTPNGTGTEPDAAANGTQCAGTNMNGDYTASAVASIITKAFTVPASGATLSFSQYIDTETAPSGDLGSIRLLNAGDDSVLAGGDVATGLEGITEAWSSQTLPLPAAANGLSVKLEFSFESDADGDLFAGFYIDDVVVTQTTP